MNTNTNPILFVDHIGRTVIAREVQRTEDTLTVDNPVILHVQPNSGRLEIQMFPYLFMEFLRQDSKNTNVWQFKLNNIVISQAVLDSKILTQYETINRVAPEPEVIKLFPD